MEDEKDQAWWREQNLNKHYINNIPNLLKINNDKELSAVLDKDNSFVFQLPVVEYPETPPIYKMQDYDQFRPYLFTSQSKFSYGTCKGRGEIDWQKHAEESLPESMQTPVDNGFNFVLINNDAFPDGGKALFNKISDRVVLKLKNESWTLLKFLIDEKVSSHDTFTPYRWIGWRSDELTHRWSTSSSPEIIFFVKDADKNYNLVLSGDVLVSQTLSIEINAKSYKSFSCDPSKSFIISLPKIDVINGFNRISFQSSLQPARPKNGDPRKVNFNIKTIELKCDKT
jgi:hypothetical protein